MAESIVNNVTNDFNLMKDMFFRSILVWNAILKDIRDFETEFNENARN